MAGEEEAEQANNAPLSATEIFKKNRKFVVEIQADFGLVSSRGTGIIIGDGYILSDAHVVFDKKSNRGVAYAADEILCKDASQNVYQLDLIYADIKKDIVRCIPTSCPRTALLFAAFYSFRRVKFGFIPLFFD